MRSRPTSRVSSVSFSNTATDGAAPGQDLVIALDDTTREHHSMFCIEVREQLRPRVDPGVSPFLVDRFERIGSLALLKGAGWRCRP